MKTGLLIGIVLGFAMAVFVNRDQPVRCEGLKAWYDWYNQVYFDRMLPADTLIQYKKLKPGTVAQTQKIGGRFVISFNSIYNQVPNDEHLTLMHESCHIKYWNDDKHGQDWQGCMEELYNREAFKEDLIGVYATE